MTDDHLLLRQAARLAEVVAVFLLAMGAVILLARSPFASWERVNLFRPFAEYLALALVAGLGILLSRSPAACFGLTRDNLAAQREAAWACLVPIALGKAVSFALVRLGVPPWVVEPLLAAAVVAVWARTLRQRPGGHAPGAGVLLALVPTFSLMGTASALVFYPFFLAPAEELLFRGYIQSRLNSAFGRPWRVATASMGPGLVISAALFSAFHVLNVPALVVGRLDPAWASALPTLAWGLAFGYLRESTESLLPPIVAHGVPQAIAWAFLGR